MTNNLNTYLVAVSGCAMHVLFGLTLYADINFWHPQIKCEVHLKWQERNEIWYIEDLANILLLISAIFYS